MVYRPISEYGIIGNDNCIALVDSDGSIDWCCFPSVSDSSVFARTLDAERGGHFAIRPTATYESIHGYVDATNVLQTTFETSSGRASLTDFMPVGEGTRPDRHQHAIYRRLRCEEGTAMVEVEFKPRFDYSRGETFVQKESETVVTASHSTSESPQNEARTASAEEKDTERETLGLRVPQPIELTSYGDRAAGTGLIEEGDSLWFVLQYDHSESRSPTECRRILTETEEYWRSWSRSIEEAAASIVGEQDWYEEIVRSGLVLKLLINEGTGAIYAAPTTSLPEEYGGDRNWDYRYNWVRDAKFTVQALYNLGQTEEARQYFEWFREISHDDPENVQPVYGVRGERELPERTLEHLSGYRYSTPVRIGNAAAEQRQLDTYGTIVQGLYETLLHDEHIDGDDWESIRSLLDHVRTVWDEKGPSIWEYRGEPHHYVHSKLLCWVALDRGIELAKHHDDDSDVGRWKAERRAIRTAIEEEGYSASAGSFVQHFETDDTLDATGLLIPVYEFLPPDDPRVQNTIDTVLEKLVTDGGLVRRTSGSDAPEEGRGTFLFCTFWLVDALVLSGRTKKAREIFTNALEHVDAPHLLPERLDPDTGEYLGNYPQAFSHIGLINSAVYLCSELTETDLEHDPQEEGDVRPLFRT